MKKAWKFFTRELRRNLLLKDSERKVQYFKVFEKHASGHIHFHVIFDRFLRVQVIRELWQISLTKAGHDTQGKTSGNVNISESSNIENTVNYMTKYVVKSAQDEELQEINRTRYSKSKEVVLFEKGEKSGDWIFVYTQSFQMQENIDAYISARVDDAITKLLVRDNLEKNRQLAQVEDALSSEFAMLLNSEDEFEYADYNFELLRKRFT